MPQKLSLCYYPGIEILNHLAPKYLNDTQIYTPSQNLRSATDSHVNLIFPSRLPLPAFPPALTAPLPFIFLFNFCSLICISPHYRVIKPSPVRSHLPSHFAPFLYAMKSLFTLEGIYNAKGVYRLSNNI